MTRENAMEYIKAQSPEAFLLKAKKRGFVCPKCGNGTGSDGDGIVKNPKDGRYHCFKCGEVGGDIFDLIGAAFGIESFNLKFEKAADIYGVKVEKYSGNSSLKEPVLVADLPLSENDDISDYFEKCRKNVRSTSFFRTEDFRKLPWNVSAWALTPNFPRERAVLSGRRRFFPLHGIHMRCEMFPLSRTPPIIAAINTASTAKRSFLTFLPSL